MVCFEKSRILLYSLFFVGVTTSLYAHHNSSKYFPYLEKIEDIATRRSSSSRAFATCELFHSYASSANKRGGAKSSLYSLWGNYNLQDVISSIRSVHGAAQANAITNILPVELRNRPVEFKIHGDIQMQGLALQYHYAFPSLGLTFGCGVPVIRSSAIGRFNVVFNNDGTVEGCPRRLTTSFDGDLVPNEEGMSLDQARRQAHDVLGFHGGNWSKTSFGDFEVYGSWNYRLDHRFLFRSIDNYIRCGMLVPTSSCKDSREPFSLPVMSDGHWGLYLDVLPEIELRQDWKLGILLGGLYQFKKTKNVRIPVGKEPAPFSALQGDMNINPGFTFKFSPYFTLENVADGIHLQLRYTYLRHALDAIRDERNDKTIASYITSEHRHAQETLSKWRSHFISFHVAYDAKQALRTWVMDPLFFVTYDFPMGGNGMARTHQLSLGARLHF